jgi:hypothetical protein
MFPARAFAGAYFSRLTGATGNLFFELYSSGALVATSSIFAQTNETRTFLPSGYSGLVDEVRVRALGNSMTGAGSPWIMDDVTFGSPVTPNDPDDADVGANNLQNYPVLDSATTINGFTSIAGTLQSIPNSPFTVEFFRSTTCDPSGHGQGDVPLATLTLAGSQSGTIPFTAPFGAAVPIGHFITATATDAAGNTSEFSNCVAVAAGTASIDVSPSALSLLTRDSGTLTATLNTPAGAGGTTIVLANDNPSAASVPATVAVAPGALTALIPVTTGTAAGVSHISGSATDYAAGSSAQVIVSARTMTLAPASSFVGVGKTIGGTLTLANPAPIGGVSIALTSLNTGFVTIAPATVNVAAGNSSASFTLTGVAEGPATLTASAAGYVTAMTTVTGSANQGIGQATVSFFNPAPIPRQPAGPAALPPVWSASSTRVRFLLPLAEPTDSHRRRSASSTPRRSSHRSAQLDGWLRRRCRSSIRTRFSHRPAVSVDWHRPASASSIQRPLVRPRVLSIDLPRRS